MNAVVTPERKVLESAALPHTASADLRARFNAAPQEKYWFDPLPARPTHEAERRHRQERLAAAFRLFAKAGFDKGLAGHITARDPELTDHFWVNPFGLHFSRIKVSDLLLVNRKGQIVVGNRPLNRAAFAIHVAVHERNPEVIAAAHTHSVYGKAFSTLGRNLDTLTQDSAAFHGDVVLFDDFTGMVEDVSEGERIAKALAGKPAEHAVGRHGDAFKPYKGAILRNHGILTAGPSVEATAAWYFALEDACHAQLLAEAAGQPIAIDEATARHTHEQVGGHEGALFSFQSLYEGLVETEPDFLE